MKKTLKALSMFMAVLTFLSVFSCSTTVFAENYEKYDNRKAYEKKLLTETVDNTVTSSKISHEVVEKRDEFSKTFMREDGSFTTILSEKPLHKKDNGKWKDIDNELNFGSESYRNNSGAFDVEFPKTLSEKNKVSVSNGKETLSFSLNDIESSQAKLPENYNAGKNGVEAAIDKITSKITYENVDDNTDVEYIVSSDSVKENIIVADEKSLKESYSFTIEKGYLTATVDGENNVIFKNKSKKEVFRIPAPVMADAEGNLSYDIDVALSGENSAEMVLTYTPSKEWLGSAKFPVKIDPVIELPSGDGIFVEDTIIKYDSTDPTAQTTNFNDDAEGHVSAKDDFKSEVLVKLNMAGFDYLKAPNIRTTNVVFGTRGIVEGGNLLAKPINGSYDMSTITYNDVYPTDNSPGIITYGDEIIDYYIGECPDTPNLDHKIVQFNITDNFISWLYGATNNGFAIVAEDSNTECVMVLDGIYSNNNHEWNFDTFCIVDYVDTSCTVDDYEYLTQEIGRAGTVSVNTFTRGLSLTRSDISMNGNRMPVSIDFNYNGAYNNYIEFLNYISGVNEEDFISFPYGEGFISSFFTSVFTFDDNLYNVFTPEGTTITFDEKRETTIDEETNTRTTTTTFEPDELGDTGYTLELIDSTKSAYYDNLKLITPAGEEIFFNYAGIATEIRESEANSDGTYDKITIALDEENFIKIDYVTDGAGRKYDFVYDSTTGLLSEVTCLDANGEQINAGSTQTPLKVTYSYDGEGNLIGVTYPDGKSISYTYNEDVLTKVQNIDGYNIQYTYDNLKKVTSVKEFAGTTEGNSITLTELSNRQVRVADSYTGTETYQFGTDGKLNYTFDDKGNYLKGDYAPCNDESVFKSNDYEVNSVNLLTNTSVENGSTGWANTNTSDVDIKTTRTVTSGKAYIGSKSMLVNNTYIKKTENANSYFRQNLTGLKPNTYYTLSAYINTENLVVVNDTSASGAYLHINQYDADLATLAYGHSDTIEYDTDESANRGWERVSYTFETDEDIDSLRIYLCLRNATGKAYFDCVQLEEGLGLADYNVLENSSFNNSDESWSDATVVTEDDDNAVKFIGGLPSYTEDDGEYTLEDHVASATQNVHINGKKGDVFSIGGWFKGYFDDNKTNTQYLENNSKIPYEQHTGSIAQIKVTYTYTEAVENADETTEEATEEIIEENFAVDFAPYNDGWQYAEDSFALKGDAESLDVTIIAQNIPAEVFAKDIAISVDGEAISFSEEDPTPEEIEETEEPTETEGATEPEEPSCPCDECEELDCECRCESKEACTCIQCKRRGNIEAVSEDGKTVTQKSYDGTQYMESSVQYSDDKNYIVSETDTNGASTSYSYRNDGTLASQTDARGKETIYGSNAMGYLNLAQVNVTGLSDNKAVMEILYEYDGDLLEKITQGNVEYTYAYDEWGQLKSVSVDNQKIVTYNYGTGVNRARLLSIYFGNDQDNPVFKLVYTYDSYGNVVCIRKTVNPLLAAEYRYLYDNFGNLKQITDAGFSADGIFCHIVYYKDNGIKIRDNATDTVIYESRDITPEYDEAEENQPVSATLETVNKVSYTHNIYESAYNAETGKTTEKEAIVGAKTLGTQTVSDWFGRNESATVMTKDPTDTSATGFTSISSNYLYKTTGNVTTNLITSINNTITGAKEDTVNYNYSYDQDGRITDISTVSSIANLNGSVEYEFDEAGQLVKETNGNTHYEYYYDSKGNITGRKFYSGENCVTDDSFTYGAETWEDRLTGFNGESITYDEIGNPTSYLGATLAWFGRDLAGYTKGNKAISYKYDVDGMRYRKVVKENDSVKATYDYVYSDGELILLTYTANGVANTARFVYDSFGEPRGFILNNSATYLYLKNGQGDITGIVDESGEILVRYEYDAWGSVEFIVPFGVDPSLTTILATVSPFTYRGYCYDYDIGMYYLQSRYYDPEICRFINADSTDYLGATGTVLSYNLFAYCENDGVNRVDPKGTIPAKLLAALAVAGASVALYNKFLCVRLYCWGFTHRKKNQTYSFSKNWKGLIKNRLQYSYTIKEFISAKLKNMKKQGFKDKIYNTTLSFYKNMSRSGSDLDLTLAIGGGGSFAIRITRTDKMDWQGRYFYNVKVTLKKEKFNFEYWKMVIGNKKFGIIEPHSSSQLVALINNTGYFTQKYGAFVAFTWGFTVTYQARW